MLMLVIPSSASALDIHRHSIIYLRGSQKTGTTWLEYMAMGLMKEWCQAASNSLCKDFQDLNRNYRIRLQDGHSLQLNTKSKHSPLLPHMTKTSRSVGGHKPVASYLWTIRDPRDVAISWSFWRKDPRPSFRMARLIFVIKKTAANWQAMNHMPADRVFVTQYESRLDHPLQALTKLAAFIGLHPISNQTLLKVLDLSSFGHMETLEISGKVLGSGYDGRQQRVRSGAKVRQGKYNNFQTWLSPAEIKAFAQLTSTSVETFNYPSRLAQCYFKPSSEGQCYRDHVWPF